MVQKELLETLRALNRAEKLHIMQFLVSELSQEETELPLSSTDYSIWSPYDAFEAADTMLKVLKAAEAQNYE
jgi:hypothetical protein